MSRWKLAAHLAGAGLALSGVYFVFRQLRVYGAGINVDLFTWVEWVVLAGLVLTGCVMNLCLATAWRACLQGLGAVVSAEWALSTYGMTQLARYVPGNIFHYAGRQAVGMAAGLPARALAKASLLELAFVTFSGGLLSLISIPLMLPRISELVCLSSVASLVAVAAYLIKHFMGSAIATAFVLYLAYLLLSGMTFLAVSATHNWQSVANTDWIAICGAYIAAWLIGLLTPGAPAGLGVRELVLLYLLKGRLDGEVLIFSVLLTRMIAVLADLTSYVGALALRRWTARG
ncbi:hypothetical protein J2T07_002805 [Luteibacter jiangsuensis]|uniref:Lysylphosphatidylglycerol synthase-like protein n=1 Tax=Luteibacter jiangsuensis TaxID=637577 RepID=A0ABT9T1B3_9GAMM|nr:hypothetical protein [Luteibacter jiangsuensis]MDQ0010599.1 hypothetical protein [Luteibacter jiangsuensis]